MTKRQEKFCEEFVSNGGNGAAAARSAGYTQSGAKVIASRLLGREEVQQKINSTLETIKSEKIADQTELLEFLSLVMRGQVIDHVVTPGGKVIETPPRVTERLRACESLCRIQCLFNSAAETKDLGVERYLNALESLWNEKKIEE